MNPTLRRRRAPALSTTTWAVLAGSLAIVTLGVGCATPREAVGTTTTTSAYTPGTVDLYVARAGNGASSAGLWSGGKGVCADLPRTIDFAGAGTEIVRGELADLDRWAACLTQPQLEHATVVLVGGQERRADDVFVQRAATIRDALAARGVDPSRVVIGAPTREGSPGATTSGVRVEMTTSPTVRQMPPSDAAAQRGIR